MKTQFTKWERNILHQIFENAPAGTLKEVREDFDIMDKLQLSDRDKMLTFFKDAFTEDEIASLDAILSKIGASVNQLFDTRGKVLDATHADTKTTLTLEPKQVLRINAMATQCRAFPRSKRTLDLQEKLERYVTKAEEETK